VAFLYFSSLYFIPLSVLLARAAGRGPPSTAQRTAGRELPPAAEAREPPLAAAECTSSWPRAAAGQAARERATAAVEGTGRHGARGRREELAAGRPPPPPPPQSTKLTAAQSGPPPATAAGALEQRAPGAAGAVRQFFFLLFRNRDAYRIVWIVSCDGFFE